MNDASESASEEAARPRSGRSRRSPDRLREPDRSRRAWSRMQVVKVVTAGTVHLRIGAVWTTLIRSRLPLDDSRPGRPARWSLRQEHLGRWSLVRPTPHGGFSVDGNGERRVGEHLVVRGSGKRVVVVPDAHGSTERSGDASWGVESEGGTAVRAHQGGLEDRGDSTKKAEAIAARTVNKARARAGDAESASRTSLNDIYSSRRGGLCSQEGPGGRTRDQLYEEARRKNIHGRSRMSKAQLERAAEASGR